MKENHIIGFYQKRWIFIALSALLMLIGIIGMVRNGVSLDIQFKGGAILKYSYAGELDPEKAADIAAQLLGRPVTPQVTTDIATGEHKLIINVADDYGMEAGVQKELDARLKQSFPEAGLVLSESSMVEPFFGERFFRNGITAVLLAACLVVIYVWIRFRRIGGLSAGVMALVALLHDLLMVFFTCVLFRIPIGDSFIAVALTIIGYSINDTIVIYDRIRENVKQYPKLPVDRIMDLSVSQSLTRSVFTNLAVFISVTLIYILAFAHGLDSVTDFALPLMVGTISGCYSTVCIAGPLWVMWKKRGEAKAA